MVSRQLPLVIPNEPVYDAPGFISDPSNEAARSWLGRTEVWPDRRLAIWGDADRGKTHLLRIWAARSGARVESGRCLTGPPDFAATSGIAIDDAEEADERTLLHLLNAARDLDQPVLLAARRPPARWPVSLPDLASRLRAVTAVEIRAPDDDLLRRLLTRWLAARRLVADEALRDGLMTRLPRSPDVLRRAVSRLDRDALVSRRRTVTPAMLRAALADSSFEPDQDAPPAAPPLVT